MDYILNVPRPDSPNLAYRNEERSDDLQYALIRKIVAISRLIREGFHPERIPSLIVYRPKPLNLALVPRKKKNETDKIEYLGPETSISKEKRKNNPCRLEEHLGDASDVQLLPKKQNGRFINRRNEANGKQSLWEATYKLMESVNANSPSSVSDFERDTGVNGVTAYRHMQDGKGMSQQYEVRLKAMHESRLCIIS